MALVARQSCQVCLAIIPSGKFESFVMPLEFDGTIYTTIEDLRGKYRVVPRTINRWIKADLLPAPPTISHGARVFRNFGDPEWLAAFEALLEMKKARKI